MSQIIGALIIVGALVAAKITRYFIELYDSFNCPLDCGEE